MKNRDNLFLDFVSLILGIIVIVITIVVFWDIDRNSFLLPYSFGAGTCWFLVTSYRNFREKKKLLGITFACAGILLMVFTIYTFLR